MEPWLNKLSNCDKVRFGRAISKIGVMVLVDESDAQINDSEFCCEIGQGILGKRAGTTDMSDPVDLASSLSESHFGASIGSPTLPTPAVPTPTKQSRAPWSIQNSNHGGVPLPPG